MQDGSTQCIYACLESRWCLIYRVSTAELEQITRMYSYVGYRTGAVAFFSLPVNKRYRRGDTDMNIQVRRRRQIQVLRFRRQTQVRRCRCGYTGAEYRCGNTVAEIQVWRYRCGETGMKMHVRRYTCEDRSLGKALKLQFAVKPPRKLQATNL